jgi:tRNA nucleotidyltransferase (CCA-adding enzyme)
MRIVRRAVNRVGEDVFPLLFPVKRADVMAQSDYLRQEKLDTIDQWQQLYEQILSQKQCVSLKTLAVTGRDLINLGYRPGPELGEELNTLLELVLEHPEFNTKEHLLQEACRH